MTPYKSFSYSAKGATHDESVPCQDCAGYYEDDRMAVAIVADGHGSPQYFRSNIGSQLAVEVAKESIKKFIEDSSGLKEPDIFKNIFKNQYGIYATTTGNGQKPLFNRLINNIIFEWREKVSEHEKGAPLSEAPELEAIEEKYRNKYRNDIERQYFSHAYGTTLIAVVVTKEYWFGFHVGDGRCEVLFENGEWAQPIPWDDRCFLNSTTSLCDDDASERARVWYGPTEEDRRRPVALFVNSDGVDDSYSVDEEVKQKQLERLYRSVVLSFAKDGFECTKGQLQELIERFANSGSRDDASISGIIDTDFIKKPEFIELLIKQDDSGRISE